MKRMVLIPEEKLLHYEQREKEGGQEGGGWIEDLSHDLSTIKEKDVKGFFSGDAKWMLKKQREGKDGNQKGKGFMDLAVDVDGNQKGKGFMDLVVDVDGNQKGKGESELTNDVIVRGIPKTMKTRAMALLERLKTRPDVITWDSTGQVKMNGVFIPKSNISDLISNAMRPRKSFNPKGSLEFFKVLNEINVPKDLVRNDDRWKESEKRKVTFGETEYRPIEKIQRKKRCRTWGEVLKKQRKRRKQMKNKEDKKKRNQKGGWMAYYGVPIRTDD